MTEQELNQLRYPIGRYQFDSEKAAHRYPQWIEDIDQLPYRLANIVALLNDEQLDTPYRPGGWTIRQLIHHLGDSHTNCLIRFKLALTEDTPTIKAYNQDEWVRTPDATALNVDESLMFLSLIHKKLVVILKSLTPDDLQKSFIHPELGQITLLYTIGLYAWHGNHHLVHITKVCSQNKWLK
jgi:hypothetical protein